MQAQEQKFTKAQAKKHAKQFTPGQWIYNTRLFMAAQYVGPAEGDGTTIRLMYTAWQPHGIETAWAGKEFEGAATTFIPLDQVGSVTGELLRDWDDALAEDAARATVNPSQGFHRDENAIADEEAAERNMAASPAHVETIAEVKMGGDTVYLSRYTDGLCIETALTVPGLTFPLNPATLADAFRMLADIAAHFE